MALPPTGSTITMSQIRNYFGSSTTPINLGGTLGPFIGISNGNTISMSASFGGYYFPAT
jgi:hypothetical protein